MPKKTKKRRPCKCECKKKCPQQLTHCEGTQCQEIRCQIAANGYDAESNLIYNYVQENVSYETAFNQCPVVPGGFHIATVTELNQLAHMFTYVDENGIVKKCPTLVWSTDDCGNPIIVRIAPCCGERIEVVMRSDTEKCKVQRICVANHT